MANYMPPPQMLAHGNASSNEYGPYELRDSLLSALENIQTSGSFASFRALSEAPPAGLFVNGVGDITMPLGESQARQLIASASQAPYGKGSETIVDTSVRNTWELDASKFAFKDPAWPAYVESLCDAVAEDLGIQGTVRAEVYKMLVYEKGAMFKAHTDTEKIPGMFGSLIVCLPSPHQGGEVVLKHCGQKKVFKTSDHTQSMACWYSDVSHEVLPVTSGYRWVVTYNLAIDHAEIRPTAGLQRAETKDLRGILERWLAKDIESREREYVYHVLDHDYTEANISLRALKTQDLARVQVLKEMSSELPFEIFLALLEKEEMGEVEFNHRDAHYGGYGYHEYDDEDEEESEEDHHHIEEVLETKYTVKTLHDLEGHVVTEGLQLDADDLLDLECFDDLEAEEDYEGYMGNSGPMATHWYRVTAVVIVPHDSIPSFFDSYDRYSDSQASTSPSQIRCVARMCLRPHTPESLITALVKVCKKAWQGPPTTIYGVPELAIDGEGMRDVLKIAIQRRLYALFEEAASKNKQVLPLDFFTWLREWLRDSTGDAKDNFNTIKTGLTRVVLSYPHFADQLQAITTLVPIPQDGPSPRIPDPILLWVRETLRLCLDDCVSKTVGKADGPAMVDVALHYHNSLAFLSETVLPFIHKKRDATAFVLGFFRRLHEQTILPQESTMELYREVARTFNTSTDFTKVRSDAGAQFTASHAAKRPRYLLTGPEQKEDFRTTVTHQALAEHFSAMIQTSTEEDDLVGPLVTKVVADAPQLSALELHVLWIPLLRSLIPILTSNTIPLNTASYQQLFLAVTEAYVKKYVGREPTSDRSLVRPRVQCSCSDCARLNAFLTSAAQTMGRFSVNKKRRQHIHEELESAHIDCTHLTERSGSPQTLVVTKTFRQYDKVHGKWVARRAKAVENFELFDQGHLRQLLGSDYSEIVNMEQMSSVRLPWAPATIPLSTISQPTRSPLAARTKRKTPPAEAEVIDLTSD